MTSANPGTAIHLGLPRGTAVIIGASGGIGSALASGIAASDLDGDVIGLGRHSTPPLDLTDEASIAACARHIAARDAPLRLVIIATGFLHDATLKPERSLRDLSPEHLAKSFALNAIGPALVLKHLAPLLPRDGRSIIAALSAKVGSIGDNQLGGWHSYRATKSALNQIVHTTAIELKRSRPEAICVVLHPGTVGTKLSAPFSKAGLNVRTPDTAAHDLLAVLSGLTPAQTGTFLDHQGRALPW